MLAHHGALLHQEIETHHGYVVKTTGDGVYAAFATATDALNATIAAQCSLQGATTAPLPFRVCMGLHTGAAELRDGDYYGTVVNQAARVTALGESNHVRDLHLAYFVKWAQIAGPQLRQSLLAVWFKRIETESDAG